MKTSHPVLKIITAVFFIGLLSGFVAFRAGVFEEELRELKFVSPQRLIDRINGAKIPEKTLHLFGPIETPTFSKLDPMIASSKSGVVAPLNWSIYWGIYASESQGNRNPIGMATHEGITPLLMSSSKSIEVLPVPKENIWNDKRPQFKQGKK